MTDQKEHLLQVYARMTVDEVKKLEALALLEGFKFARYISHILRLHLASYGSTSNYQAAMALFAEKIRIDSKIKATLASLDKEKLFDQLNAEGKKFKDLTIGEFVANSIL